MLPRLFAVVLLLPVAGCQNLKQYNVNPAGYNPNGLPFEILEVNRQLNRTDGRITLKNTGFILCSDIEIEGEKTFCRKNRRETTYIDTNQITSIERKKPKHIQSLGFALGYTIGWIIAGHAWEDIEDFAELHWVPRSVVGVPIGLLGGAIGREIEKDRYVQVYDEKMYLLLKDQQGVGFSDEENTAFSKITTSAITRPATASTSKLSTMGSR